MGAVKKVEDFVLHGITVLMYAVMVTDAPVSGIRGQSGPEFPSSAQPEGHEGGPDGWLHVPPAPTEHSKQLDELRHQPQPEFLKAEQAAQLEKPQLLVCSNFRLLDFEVCAAWIDECESCSCPSSSSSFTCPSCWDVIDSWSRRDEPAVDVYAAETEAKAGPMIPLGMPLAI